MEKQQSAKIVVHGAEAHWVLLTKNFSLILDCNFHRDLPIL